MNKQKANSHKKYVNYTTCNKAVTLNNASEYRTKRLMNYRANGQMD